MKTLGKIQIMGVTTTPEMNRVPEISLGIYQLTNHEKIPKCWVFRVYKFAKILLGFLLCSFGLNSVHNLAKFRNNRENFRNYNIITFHTNMFSKNISETSVPPRYE